MTARRCCVPAILSIGSRSGRGDCYGNAVMESVTRPSSDAATPLRIVVLGSDGTQPQGSGSRRSFVQPRSAASAICRLSRPTAHKRLDDVAAVPGNRLEALAGDRKGLHSIRVNQQYRITFRWERHDAYDVCCEDDH